MTNNITKRGNHFYYQRRIPNELSKKSHNSKLFGKKLYQISLKTSVPNEARLKAAKMNLWFEEQLHLVRNHTDPASVYRSLIDDKLDPMDAFSLSLEAIEEDYGISFEREQGESVDIPNNAKLALKRLRKAAEGSLQKDLRQLGDECKRDLLEAGVISKKGLLGKLNPAIRWLHDAMGVDVLYLDDLKPRDVKNAVRLTYRAGLLASSTISGHLRALRAIWKYAKVEYDLAYRSPFDDISIKVKSDSYDRLFPDEIDTLHNLADPEIRLAIRIGATTGARISEVASISTVKDTPTGQLFWSIKPNGDGKTKNSTRLIPVHPRLLGEISEGFSLGISGRTLSRKMKDAMTMMKAQLGITDRKLSFHSFRSHVASELAFTNKFTTKEIELYTGHRSQGSEIQRKRTIDTYIQCPSKNTLVKMARQLCWPFKN